MNDPEKSAELERLLAIMASQPPAPTDQIDALGDFLEALRHARCSGSSASLSPAGDLYAVELHFQTAPGEPSTRIRLEPRLVNGEPVIVVGPPSDPPGTFALRKVT